MLNATSKELDEALGAKAALEKQCADLQKRVEDMLAQQEREKRVAQIARQNNMHQARVDIATQQVIEKKTRSTMKERIALLPMIKVARGAVLPEHYNLVRLVQLLTGASVRVLAEKFTMTKSTVNRICKEPFVPIDQYVGEQIKPRISVKPVAAIEDRVRAVLPGVLRSRRSYRTLATIAADCTERLGEAVSRYYVHKVLVSCGYRFVTKIRQIILREEHREARVAYATRMLEMAKEYAHGEVAFWKHLCFDDEMMITPYDASRRAWQSATDRVLRPTERFPPKRMVIGFISAANGMHVEVCNFKEYHEQRGTPRNEPRGFTSGYYCDVVLEKMFFPRRYVDAAKTIQLILIDDNASPHCKGVFRKWNEDHRREYINLRNIENAKHHPARSPDLNPIENMWSIIREEVSKKQLTSIEQVPGALEEIVARPAIQDQAKTMALGFKKRLEEVIRRHGAMLDY